MNVLSWPLRFVLGRPSRRLPPGWRDRFPAMPEMLEDEQFVAWARTLDSESQLRLIDDVSKGELKREGFRVPRGKLEHLRNADELHRHLEAEERRLLYIMDAEAHLLGWPETRRRTATRQPWRALALRGLSLAQAVASALTLKTTAAGSTLSAAVFGGARRIVYPGLMLLALASGVLTFALLPRYVFSPILSGREEPLSPAQVFGPPVPATITADPTVGIAELDNPGLATGSNEPAQIGSQLSSNPDISSDPFQPLFDSAVFPKPVEQVSIGRLATLTGDSVPEGADLDIDSVAPSRRVIVGTESAKGIQLYLRPDRDPGASIALVYPGDLFTGRVTLVRSSQTFVVKLDRVLRVRSALERELEEYQQGVPFYLDPAEVTFIDPLTSPWAPGSHVIAHGEDVRLRSAPGLAGRPMTTISPTAGAYVIAAESVRRDGEDWVACMDRQGRTGFVAADLLEPTGVIAGEEQLQQLRVGRS